MTLKHLSIINYKNLAQVELELSPKINCFVGNNGMGKTNLLDAVYYLSFCRSYTNPVDSQIIKHDADVCMLQGRYELEGQDGEEEIYCGLRRRQKKQFKRNKKEYEKLSDHIGFIPLVMISPADIEIIQGGSEERRKFMDMAISQFDKAYMHALIRYNNALQQRNATLKMDDNEIDFTLLELWEDQMAGEGELIFEKRQAFVKEFIPVFDEFYKRISLSNEKATFDYVSQLRENNFREALRQTRRRDIAVGHTTTGIHRDELEMLLDGFPIKKVGSQGQNKTYFVSMKLAQFHYLLKTGKRTPILLLDDIFDRLDAYRVEEIVKLVSSNEFGQIFISDTNRHSFDKILERINNSYRIYSVKHGEITISL